MQPSTSPSQTTPKTSTEREASIRHLPAEARAAYQRFQTAGDLAALDVVLAAVLEDHLPGRTGGPLATLPGGTRLIEDLGFDSLAITEAVFFIEDLFGIVIANEEIVLVRTLDELRSFVRDKVTAGAKA